MRLHKIRSFDCDGVSLFLFLFFYICSIITSIYTYIFFSQHLNIKLFAILMVYTVSMRSCPIESLGSFSNFPHCQINETHFKASNHSIENRNHSHHIFFHASFFCSAFRLFYFDQDVNDIAEETINIFFSKNKYYYFFLTQ